MTGIISGFVEATGIDNNPLIGGMIGIVPGATLAGASLLGRGVGILAGSTAKLASTVATKLSDIKETRVVQVGHNDDAPVMLTQTHKPMDFSGFAEASNAFGDSCFEFATKNFKRDMLIAGSVAVVGGMVGIGSGAIHDAAVDINQRIIGFFKIPEAPQQSFVQWARGIDLPRDPSQFEQFCEHGGYICQVLNRIKPNFQG